MIGFFLKLATSRMGLFAIAGLALFTWHTLDKGSAVRKAVAGYVADVELAAANAELEVLRQREAALRQANFTFQMRLTESEALATRQTMEIESYESRVADVCVVDDDLIDQLHNK